MLLKKGWLFRRRSIVIPFFLSLLSFISIHAQPRNPAVDSIQRLLDKHPAQDTVRVKLLLGLTEFTVDDYKLKRSIAEEARTLSKKLKYETGEAAALVHIGV